MVDSELPTDLRRPCTPSRGPSAPPRSAPAPAPAGRPPSPRPSPTTTRPRLTPHHHHPATAPPRRLPSRIALPLLTLPAVDDAVRLLPFGQCRGLFAPTVVPARPPSLPHPVPSDFASPSVRFTPSPNSSPRRLCHGTPLPVGAFGLLHHLPPRPLVPHLVPERPPPRRQVAHYRRPRRLPYLLDLVPVSQRAPRRQVPLQEPHRTLPVRLHTTAPLRPRPGRHDRHLLQLHPHRVHRPPPPRRLRRRPPQRQPLPHSVLPHVLQLGQHLSRAPGLELRQHLPPHLQLHPPHRPVVLPLAPPLGRPRLALPLKVRRLVVEPDQHRPTPPEPKHGEAPPHVVRRPLTRSRHEPPQVRRLQLESLHVRVDVHMRHQHVRRYHEHRPRYRPLDIRRRLGRSREVQVCRVDVRPHRGQLPVRTHR
jgi:hypothetical protein